ncbi:MAG TPA: hypothetical protein V6C86_07165 [Oculatellaceae cyanobacterium]
MSISFNSAKQLRLQINAAALVLLLSIADSKASCAATQSAVPETSEPQQASSTQTLSYQDNLNRLDLLTRNILRKEAELDELNTIFRMKTSLVSKARQRRMFAYSEIQSSCTLASQIMQIHYRYFLAKVRRPNTNLQFDTEQDIPDTQELQQEEKQFSQEPAAAQKAENSQYTLSGVKFQKGIQRSRLALAAKAQLVGQAVGVVGDIFEVDLNFINYLKLRHQRLTPAFYRQRVQVLHTQLDSLLTERKSAISQMFLTNDDTRVINAETQLLGDLRDLCLQEYGEFSAATMRFWFFQNTGYFMDFAKNGTSVAGSAISLAANHTRRPRMAGSAGLFSIITGGIVLLVPAAGRVTGNLSASGARKLVSKELRDIEAHEIRDYMHDADSLRAIVGTPTVSLQSAYAARMAQRSKSFSIFAELLNDVNKYQEAQQKKAHASLVENVTFAALVGPPRIANGVTQVLGAWRFEPDAPFANKLFAAGATAYTVGTSINLLETIRLNINFERNNWKTRNKGGSVRQFQHRLKLLDEVKTTVTARQQTN